MSLWCSPIPMVFSAEAYVILLLDISMSLCCSAVSMVFSAEAYVVRSVGVVVQPSCCRGEAEAGTQAQPASAAAYAPPAAAAVVRCSAAEAAVAGVPSAAGCGTDASSAEMTD